MGQMLFIVWRESVEALLVVGILYAWLKNGGEAMRAGVRYLWCGVLAGIVVACALGAGMFYFAHAMSGDAQTYFQIAMLLIAAFLILHMVFWMRRHGRTFKSDVESALHDNTRREHWWGVFVLVMIAIAREGSEMAVFLFGVAAQQSTTIQTVSLAIVLGLLLALLTFYLLQLGGKVFSWRRFFHITEVILLVLAASLIVTGVERVVDVLLDNTDALWVADIGMRLTESAWDSTVLLRDDSIVGNFISTLTGYRAHPTWLNLMTYIGYWSAVVVAMRHQVGRMT